jgi:hypothetical protein
MGDNLETKIGSITVEEAFVKPLPTVHSVAELIAHLTAWNNDTILKINNGTGKLRDSGKDNWPENGQLKEFGFERLLQEYYRSVKEVVSILNMRDDAFLSDRYFDQDFHAEFDIAFALNGMLHHTIYHLGQIGIVIKLIKGK